MIYIIIWYTALQITHMILQCDIQIATLRKKPGLVAVGLRSRPLPGENSANDQPSSAVKGKTYNWNLFPQHPGSQKNIQNNPRPLDLISAIGPEQPTQRSDRLSDLDFVAPRFRRVSGHGFWLLRSFLSLIFCSPKNLEDKLKLDKFNFIQCFSSNPTTSTALGMKWSRSSASH